MELKNVRVADIKPYPNNPRRNDEAVDAVAESIRQCGYCAPIVVDENMVILAGHTRQILVQGETQHNKGGMTETYIDNGTYVKTFPTIMLNPSSTKVSMMGQSAKRIHHRIYWRRAVPMILNERYRKS